jgi:hypothetical protein
MKTTAAERKQRKRANRRARDIYRPLGINREAKQ